MWNCVIQELMEELKVQAAHNAVEACAQTKTLEKVVFTSSVATTILREDGDCKVNALDERHWSDANLCRKLKACISDFLSDKIVVYYTI